MAAADAPSASRVLAGLVRDVRKRKGWSQERLSEELASLGVKLHPTAIVKIERGERGVSLDDALALAAALRLPLTSLVTPRGAAEAMAVTPEVVMDARTARTWLKTGWSFPRPFPGGASELNRFLLSELPEDEWKVHQREGMSGVLTYVRELVDATVDNDHARLPRILDRLVRELQRQRDTVEPNALAEDLQTLAERTGGEIRYVPREQRDEPGGAS